MFRKKTAVFEASDRFGVLPVNWIWPKLPKGTSTRQDLSFAPTRTSIRLSVTKKQPGKAHVSKNCCFMKFRSETAKKVHLHAKTFHLRPLPRLYDYPLRRNTLEKLMFWEPLFKEISARFGQFPVTESDRNCQKAYLHYPLQRYSQEKNRWGTDRRAPLIYRPKNLGFGPKNALNFLGAWFWKCAGLRIKRPLDWTLLMYLSGLDICIFLYFLLKLLCYDWSHASSSSQFLILFLYDPESNKGIMGSVFYCFGFSCSFRLDSEGYLMCQVQDPYTAPPA